MAAEFHQQVLQAILETYFTGAQSKPANFYVGLSGDDSLAENAALADITEVSGPGYGRVTVAANAATILSGSVGTNDWRMTFPEVTWNATGDWTVAKRWFVATTSDNTGKLTGSAPLSGGDVTLANGGSISERPRLQLAG